MSDCRELVSQTSSRVEEGDENPMEDRLDERPLPPAGSLGEIPIL
jgi:hypothetical protein